MLELGGKVLLSYLIGSVMGSIIVGRLRGGVDIRTMGSGNPGGTNALRTQGFLFALGVMVVDVGKGVVAAGIVPGLQFPGTGAGTGVPFIWLAVACAAASVVGHVWPVYHRFRGGKGAATLIGTIVVLAPGMVLPLVLVWAWMLVLTGYVGLATMTAAVAAPLFLVFMKSPYEQPLVYYCAAMALYMIYSHRSNIGRMRDGTEPKNTRLMVFRRNRQNSSNGQ